MVGVTIIFIIFASWPAVEYLFTTARINTRCLIPECESEPGIEFRPEWILNAVPESGASFHDCSRFSPSNVTRVSDADTCPAYRFQRDKIIACEDFVYETTYSVVYDYGLACDEWRRSLIGSVRTFGSLMALPITGYISDHWGRRTALCINAFNTAWLGVTRYFADTYIGFLISEVVEATFGSGGYSCAYILLMEVVGPKYRVAAGATFKIVFSIGQIMLALIAWAVPDWRTLTLVLYIPQVITISYYWLIYESIRWHLSKGHYEEAGMTLKKVAKINGKQLSEKSIEWLRVSAEELQKERELEKHMKATEPWLIVILFRHKRVLLRVLVSPVWWITSTLIYYGLSVNAVNMSGNRYLNYIAVAAVEIPGYWVAVLLLNRIGRKPVLVGAYWLCAACQIAYIFTPQDMNTVSMIIFLVGKWSIAMVSSSIYLYTMELYPTRYRHSLFAFSSMMGRIGSIIAPLTPAF
ncbi:organic cation transporter protein-like [Leptidea sinapis]|uniref:organic cation transporter protein-like n=1 Tax=Leptidea sinapis TaxID=189913 RepID=UPI0021C4BC4A|nr:organic cation transporter protein-like [Leptidea sinapis]